MRKSQFSFFHELKKRFCHHVLQMKQCFGRINFDVFTKGLASSRKMIRRRWSFLVTKDFWRMKKDLFVFSSQWAFSFEKHFLHTCNWFCPQKKNVFTTQCCFEKRTWKWQWKKTKSFTAKSSRILEDFLDLSWENEEISKVVHFFFVWWNEIGRNNFPFERH